MIFLKPHSLRYYVTAVENVISTENGPKQLLYEEGFPKRSEISKDKTITHRRCERPLAGALTEITYKEKYQKEGRKMAKMINMGNSSC